MAWLMFRALQQPWQYGSSKILIRGFQKGKTRPCTSRGTKVTGCQIFMVLVETWTSCNFDAPWGTRPCFTFLETSNQYLKGARLSWVLQRSKRLPGHAEKLYTRLKTNAQNCMISSMLLPATYYFCYRGWPRAYRRFRPVAVAQTSSFIPSFCCQT